MGYSKTMQLVLTLTAAYAAACFAPCSVRAADNREEVKKSLRDRYEKVYFGKELTVEEVAKAFATKGASLVAFAEETAQALQKAQVNITRDAILDVLLRGRDIPDISGGIAAIQHWHIEKVPYVEFQGIKTRVRERDVRIPEPNSHLPWIGYRKKSNGHPPADQLPLSLAAGRRISLRTVHDLYVTAPPVDERDKGHVRQARDRQEMETFELVDSPHGRGSFGLKTHHGKYVTAVPPSDPAQPGRIRQANDLGKMETFEFIPLGENKFALRTMHGLFVTATPLHDAYEGNLRQAPQAGQMETFIITVLK